MSGARCLWRRWCSGRRRVRPPAWCALLGRAAWCARGRRPAREPSALRASLGASSRSPARPRRRPRAPQPGPPAPSTLASLVSLCVVELPLEARSCPAAAHGYRSLALRHPGLAVLLLVAPLMFWAPSGPAARVVCLARPGCLVRPWAAARPRAVRAASFARRVVSKPGQAPPPPTGTAAWPSGPSDALHTGGACVAVCGGASHRSPARPCRRPWVLQVGYPDPPALSMPAVLPGFAIDRIARGYCTG